MDLDEGLLNLFAEASRVSNRRMRSSWRQAMPRRKHALARSAGRPTATARAVRRRTGVRREWACENLSRREPRQLSGSWPRRVLLSGQFSSCQPVLWRRGVTMGTTRSAWLGALCLLACTVSCREEVEGVPAGHLHRRLKFGEVSVSITLPRLLSQVLRGHPQAQSADARRSTRHCSSGRARRPARIRACAPLPAAQNRDRSRRQTT